MATIDLKFDKGDNVRDKVTGYSGVVTGYAYYYGVEKDTYRVETLDGTGRPVDWWFSASRLVKIEPPQTKTQEIAKEAVKAKTKSKKIIFVETPAKKARVKKNAAPAASVVEESK